MIEAAAILARQDYHFELYFIGNSNAHLEEKATKLGLLNRVIFIKPSVSYEEVANQMKVSSALLLFSRFENLPCVLLEALCCGLPVISSRVGGINEIVNETNGILVSSENVQELATAMKHMMENYSGYNRTRISEEAIGIFNYPAIGGLYYDWYKKITNDLVGSG